MKSKVVASEEFFPGQQRVIEGQSPSGRYCAVFEDDGETGYLYATDISGSECQVLDAVHIYSAQEVADRNIASRAVILWSSDHQKVALLINQRPHAVFDFSAKRGYCRDNFPEPSPSNGWQRLGWDDSLRDLFT